MTRFRSLKNQKKKKEEHLVLVCGSGFQSHLFLKYEQHAFPDKALVCSFKAQIIYLDRDCVRFGQMG
jgi:hypothetical protein